MRYILVNKNYLIAVYKAEKEDQLELAGTIKFINSEWVVISHSWSLDWELEDEIWTETEIARFSTELEAIEFAKKHWNIVGN